MLLLLLYSLSVLLCNKTAKRDKRRKACYLSVCWSVKDVKIKSLIIIDSIYCTRAYSEFAKLITNRWRRNSQTGYVCVRIYIKDIQTAILFWFFILVYWHFFITCLNVSPFNRLSHVINVMSGSDKFALQNANQICSCRNTLALN